MDKLIEYIVNFTGSNGEFDIIQRQQGYFQNLEEAKIAATDYLINRVKQTGWNKWALEFPILVEINLLTVDNGLAKYIKVANMVVPTPAGSNEDLKFDFDWTKMPLQQIEDFKEAAKKCIPDRAESEEKSVFDDPDIQMEAAAEDVSNECSAIMGEFDKHIGDELLGSTEYYALAARLEKIDQHNASEILENMGTDEYTHYLILLGIREVLQEECR